MLNLTDEQKALFKESGHFPGYIFTFSDIDLTITNETIHDQAVTVKESIMDSSELTLGGCIASSIEFEVSEVMANDITGHEFTARLEVTDADDNVELSNLPMGTYTPTTVQQVDDKDYKKVTAYDRLTRATADVSDWYNTWFGDGDTHTVKETRESLLSYLGIPYVVQNLTNDTYVCEKTVESAQMIGLDILKMLCAINGGFGRMNRSGQFEVITLAEITGSEPDTSEDYRTVKYEEYTSEAVTGIIVKGTTDDVGIDVGDKDTNPYIITGNIFLYNNTTDEQKTAIRTVATNILNLIKNIEYRPYTSNIDGLPYMECGDIFKIEKENDTLESYIFSRTLSGVAYLQDQYEAKGTQERKNEVSATSEMYRNAGKQFVFTTSVNGLKAELTNFETNTKTSLELLDGQIASKVSTEEMNSSITQSADEIKSTVSTAESKYHERHETEVRPESITTRMGTYSDSDIWVGITYGEDAANPNGIWYAISRSGQIAYWRTGDMTWSMASSSFYDFTGDSGSILAFAYGDGKYIIVTGYGSSAVKIWKNENTMLDSSGYQQYPDTFTEKTCQGITYGEDKGFFAILGNGVPYYLDKEADSWVSGAVTSYSGAEHPAYINGKYFVVATNTIPHIDYNDSNRWVAGTTLTGEPQFLAYGNGIYVATVIYYPPAVESVKSGIVTSTDGVNWTEGEFIPDTIFNYVLFNSDLNVFFMFGYDSTWKTYYSQDGISWEYFNDISANASYIYSGSAAYHSDKLCFATNNLIQLATFNEVETSYKISLYGYGNPTENEYYTKSENIGKYYLDNQTGYVYLLADDLTWSKVDELTEKDTEYESSIEQLKGTIILSVRADNKMVKVELGANPETGSEFKVDADDIELTSEQIMNLISNGDLNLTGKNITISSDKFNVTSEGEVEAGALRITGGEFDVSTNTKNKNVLTLKGVSGLENAYINPNGSTVINFDYCGEGEPNEEFGENGEYYLDISEEGGEAWLKSSSGIWGRYTYSEILGDVTKVYMTTLSIDTDGGYSLTNYRYKDSLGEWAKEENSIHLSTGEIVWTISALTGGQGGIKTKTARMGIEVAKFTGALSDDFEHRLTSDSTIQVPKLEIGEGWIEETSSGSITHDPANFTAQEGVVTLNEGTMELPFANITNENITNSDIENLFISGKRINFTQVEIGASAYPSFYEYRVSNLSLNMPVHVCLANADDNFGTITKYGINQTNSSIEIYHDVGSYTGTIKYNIMYFTDI